jgi:hypothetical protein
VPRFACPDIRPKLGQPLASELAASASFVGGALRAHVGYQRFKAQIGLIGQMSVEKGLSRQAGGAAPSAESPLDSGSDDPRSRPDHVVPIKLPLPLTPEIRGQCSSPFLATLQALTRLLARSAAKDTLDQHGDSSTTPKPMVGPPASVVAHSDGEGSTG